MKYKIAIWTPTNSPHQKNFLKALKENSKIDVEIRYFLNLSKERKLLGWQENNFLEKNEKYTFSLEEAIKSLKDFNDRIHIIGGFGYKFTKDLIDYCIINNLKWIIWSEKRGVSLFYKVKQNYKLYKFLLPLYTKFYIAKDAKLIDRYGLGFLANGYLAKEQYKKAGLSEKKINYLFYAINPLKKVDITAKEVLNSNYKYHFLYIGSLYKLKGIDVLLKAFSKIKNNNKDWALILVGYDKSNGYYKNLAERLDILDRVFFVNSVNIDKVNIYYSIGDVFILPSLHDGWGVVLNEAASIGLPLIATNEVGGAYHLIKNNENGFRIKANSIDALRKAMEFYVSSPDMIKKHGEKSKDIFFKEFTPEKNVERLISALEKWLG